MAGKRKHAMRSRKTYRERMRCARWFLQGSIPVWMKRLMGL